jgi:chemotaxis protein CheD
LKISTNESNNSQGNIYYVGIGEVHIGFSGDQLKISALGSCVGLVLYPNDDYSNRCATMGHIMLPKSSKSDLENPKRKSKWDLTRFADIAVPVMIKNLMKAVGHKKHRKKAFVAKIIGGAEMFGMTKLSYKIGKENTRITKQLLKDNGIPLIKEYTGGDTGMSIDFNVNDYSLKVKPTGGKEFYI